MRSISTMRFALAWNGFWMECGDLHLMCAGSVPNRCMSRSNSSEKNLPRLWRQIKQALGHIQGGRDRYFISRLRIFPTSKAPRVFWIGIAAGPELGTLAKSVDETTAALGVPREEHEFNPHLTLARRGSSGTPHRLKGDSVNPAFHRLQEKLAAMSPLDFGTMTAREFFLYQSQPMQGGARYTKIARFGLG